MKYHKNNHQIQELDLKSDNEKDNECQETVEDEQMNYASGNNDESGENKEAILEIGYSQQDSDSKEVIKVEQQVIEKAIVKDINDEQQLEIQDEDNKQQVFPSVMIEVQNPDTSSPKKHNSSNSVEINYKLDRLIQSTVSDIDYSQKINYNTEPNKTNFRSSKIVYTDIDLQEKNDNIDDKNRYEIETHSFTNQDLYGHESEEFDTSNQMIQSKNAFECENKQDQSIIHGPNLLESSIPTNNGKFSLFKCNQIFKMR